MPVVTQKEDTDYGCTKEPMAATIKRKFKYEPNWLHLPFEVWLSILTEYGLTAKDLVNMDMVCKWFGWNGLCMTEEAARLILKRKMRPRVGELINRVHGICFKEKLFHLEATLDNLSILAAGSYQNIVCHKGRLCTWGAGRFGQLGNKARHDTAQLQDITESIPQESGRVVQVSAGCGHSGVVTECGHAYTFGDNRYNQLGHTPLRSQTCTVPTRVCMELSSKRVLQIACGSSHTLFITDMGQVYVNGQGESGQLGLGTRRGLATEPTLVPLPYDEYNVIFITTGIAHNILMTQCGRVFTFGLGSVGQLGHGGTKNIFQPTMVSVLRQRKITYAAAGVSHSIFIDSSGLAYTCGKGKGILGHGDQRIRTVPCKVESLEMERVKVVRASAGVGRSIFISSLGHGYWCGEGMGEQNNHTANLPTVMRLPEVVVGVSIGNSHSVLQMRSGRLMSMGCNGRHQTGVCAGEGWSTNIDNYTYIET